MDSRFVSGAALAVPLLLVNSVAVYGQVQWASKHLSPHLAVALGFALAVESIGVYLAVEAHRALLAGDAALRLRLGSYGIGALAGALNYAHFSPSGTPNARAVAFGVLSAISPVLWAIRSRSLSRAELRRLHLIDGRAVKFTGAQWLLFPRKSARAFRAAVWAAETNPGLARALIEAPVPTVRVVMATSPVRLSPSPAALPGEPQTQEPSVAVGAPALPEPVAINGKRRIRPQDHPLWEDWYFDWTRGERWSDDRFMRALGDESVTMAAVRARRQRWEKQAAALGNPQAQLEG